MNAQIIGDRFHFERVLGHAFGKRTENGNRFVQLCAMNKLMVGSTLFEQKDVHKITWFSNDHKTLHRRSFVQARLEDSMSAGHPSAPWGSICSDPTWLLRRSRCVEKTK